MRSLFLRPLLLGDYRAPEWQQCASQISIESVSLNLGGNNPDIKKKHNETFQNDIYIYMILYVYVCIILYNIHIYILYDFGEMACFLVIRA